MKPHYYNEYDEYAAQWLRNLMKAGHLPDGDVDTRSIVDVQPDDLFGYTQAHFFAGIGGWALAAKLAGWPEDRELWTGSCPCQPFSIIGQQKGEDDERHLWPVFGKLIEVCKPATVFGEQVASKAGREWLAGVRTDLERMGYEVGAADLCAAGVGAPHMRQRVYWVGDADYARLERHTGDGDEFGRALAPRSVPPASRAISWDDSVLIADRLGNTRRCQHGISPMAARLPAYVGLLRAYGNAIVPPLAAEFMKAYMDCRP